MSTKFNDIVLILNNHNDMHLESKINKILILYIAKRLRV